VCRCINVDIGSYANQVPLTAPWGRTYGIDRCIADEIASLWALGIRTTGCCCGHNTQRGFIGVEDEDIERMKCLGYTVRPNEIRPGAEDSFYPKEESPA